MTDKATLLEDVKKHIRSLLVSAGATEILGQSLTADQVENDYRDMIDKNGIPIRKMGYPTVEAFYRDIPDVVLMRYSGNQLNLLGVSDEKTDHIARMIGRQKNKPKVSRGKKGPGRGSGRGGRGGRPLYGGTRRSPLMYRQPQYYGYSSYNPYTDSYGYPMPIQNMFYEELYSQKKLPMYVEPAVSGHTRTGQKQPDRKPPTVPAATRAKLCDFLSGYPNGVLGSNLAMAFSRRYPGETLRAEDYGFQTLWVMLSTLTDIIKLEELRSGGFKVHMKPLSPKRGTRKPRTTTTSNATKDLPEVRYSSDGKTFSKSLIEDIRKVLAKHPNGIRSINFGDEFKRETGQELPIRELGRMSVIDMMSAIPDVVAIERPNRKDWLLFDARHHQSEPKPPRKPVLEEKKVPVSTAPGIPADVKETIRQVLLAYKDGVDYSEFQNCYRYCTGKDLPVCDLGFATLSTLLLNIPDVVQISYAQGLMKLMGLGNPVPSTESLLQRQPGAEGDIYPKVGGIPADAVGPGVNYLTQMMPRQKDFMEVIVSHIETPGEFYFQIKGANTTNALENLMDELERFYYGEASSRYRMPDFMIAVNQVCAGIFVEDSNWHRVYICGMKGLDFVECMFVDYGTISTVHKENLRLLKNRFFKLPAQGIKAKLRCLAPANGRMWTAESKRRMMELVREIAVLAIGPQILPDGTVALCLCDTSSEQDIHINDTLLDEGHAIYIAEETNENEAPPEAEGEEEEEFEFSDAQELQQWQEQLEESRRVKQAMEMGLQPRHIMCVQLTDEHLMHVVKYKDRPYAISNQVAALLGAGVSLRSELRAKKLKFDFEVLTNEQQPDLYSTFDQYEVPGTTDPDGKVKSHISIYPLESVIEILKLLGKSSEEVINSLQEQLEDFDPNDGYWLGEDDDDESTSSGPSMELDLADYENALETLQFRRQRIVQAMISQDTELQRRYSPDDLQQIEEKMVELTKIISKTKDAPKKPVTKEDAFIQTCIGEQYGAAKAKNAKTQVVQPMPSTRDQSYIPQASQISSTAPGQFGITDLSALPGMSPGLANLPGATGQTNPVAGLAGLQTAAAGQNPLAGAQNPLTSLLGLHSMAGLNLQGPSGQNPGLPNLMGGSQLPSSPALIQMMSDLGLNQSQNLLQYQLFLSQVALQNTLMRQMVPNTTVPVSGTNTTVPHMSTLNMAAVAPSSQNIQTAPHLANQSQMSVAHAASGSANTLASHPGVQTPMSGVQTPMSGAQTPMSGVQTPMSGVQPSSQSVSSTPTPSDPFPGYGRGSPTTICTGLGRGRGGFSH